MKFVTVDHLVDGFETELIGRPVSGSRFDAASGQPSGESAAVVVASL